jgi:DNA replication protein DnaC
MYMSDVNNTNINKCLLSGVCLLAGNADYCYDMCPSYIGMHGVSGKSGRVGSANVPKEYRLVTLANSPAKKNQPAIYRELNKYIKSFNRMFEENHTNDPLLRIKNFYFYSKETGTGKTTTACALLNEFLIRHYTLSIKQNRQPLNMPAFYLDVNAWQGLYNTLTRPDVPKDLKEEAGAKYYQRMKYAKTAPFVVMDDIGVRDATDPFISDLLTIINDRITNHLITVYTSNIALEALQEVYGQRLWDRARDLTQQFNFAGDSKRGTRR